MKKALYISSVCLFAAIAFIAPGVFAVENGGAGPKPGVVSTGTDSMGHDLDKYSYREAPSRHIPDIRVYCTQILEYDVYTEYEHDIVYNPKFDKGRVVRFYNESSYDYKIDHFTRLYLNDANLFAKQHECVMHKALDDGFSLDVYWISKQAREYENKTYIFKGEVYLDYLEVLKDGDKTVWVSARRSFLDVKRYGNGYMILSNGGVDYITYEQGKRFSDYYVKPFNGGRYPFEAMPEYRPVSGRILTANIVRIEYPSGCVAHWKIKLTKEDCDKNIASREIESPNRFKAGASVVWHNGAGNEVGKNYRLPAWDFSESPKEPEYEYAWSEAIGGNASHGRPASDRRENTGVWKRLLGAITSIRNKLSELFNIG